MMMTTGGRVSARQLQRDLGVTYKTAWRIRDKLRLAMSGGEPVWRELAATLAGHRTGPQQGPSPTDTDVPVAVADHGGDTHHNLPTYLTRFVGREREIRAAIRWLRRSRLVTLVGPGGCGKTRLALRVAMTEFERHRDGVWWVDLARLAPGQAITGAVSTVVGVPERSDSDPAAGLIRRLKGASTLMVLDNCEHVLGECADLAERLLSACPAMRLLATSREPFALAGELVYPVPSLPVPDATTAPVPDVVGRVEAVRLFVDRATMVRPGFRLDTTNVDAVADICRQVDGIALAIELAAARVATLSPAQIASALTDALRILTAGRRAWR